MSVILGLHYGHNGSACIVKDGKLIGAIASERVTGNKYCFGTTNEVLNYLFNFTGISENEITMIALSDWNKDYAFDTIRVFQGEEEITCLWNSIYCNNVPSIQVEFRGRTIPGYYVGHQFCHAAAAFYTSPYDKAFCFTMDASGAKHKNNSLICYGDSEKLLALYCPGLMVGVAYGFFTEYLGLGPQMFKAGTTMALSGYGKPLQKVVENIEKYVDGCFFEDHQEYRGWYSTDLWFDLSGGDARFTSEQSDSEASRNIAATIQLIFQKAVLKCIDSIDSGEIKNICLGGGSMLNCTVNSLILESSKFDNVHLFPACGDDGLSVGAALYVAHHILDHPRIRYHEKELCYLGADKSKVEPDYSYLAEKLANGKILAWSNGRSEYGPRALGNRSILADPRNPENRERINSKIKNREWFRPLAPIVLRECLSEWFHFTYPSPFMLYTAGVRNPGAIPAVNHIDNTSRMQTIDEYTNPQCYRLIRAFYKLTGVPILLNTSLNINGYPIVETDEDARNFFEKNDVDILVLNGKIFEK